LPAGEGFREVITPEDDLLHPGSRDPYWTETGWFSFSVPERQMNGFVYVYHRPNMGTSAGGPGMYDLSGEETYNCIYWGLDPAMPVPADLKMFDFSLPNGLSMETIELQKSYRIRYQRYGDVAAVLQQFRLRREEGGPVRILIERIGVGDGGDIDR
jgi:hypothetical protein